MKYITAKDSYNNLTDLEKALESYENWCERKFPQNRRHLAALKALYSGAILKDLVYAENPLLKMMKKDDK